MNIKEAIQAAARLNAAFPSTHTYGDTDTEIFHTGLSKRELFAAMAMHGMYSKSDWGSYHALSETSGLDVADMLAQMSMDAADALLNKLEEPLK